eukprot:Skav219786  [mRNA]  locus=scaffold3701:93223:93435:- [translate_table: standard]
MWCPCAKKIKRSKSFIFILKNIVTAPKHNDFCMLPAIYMLHSKNNEDDDDEDDDDDHFPLLFRARKMSTV